MTLASFTLRSKCSPVLDNCIADRPDCNIQLTRHFRECQPLLI